MKKIIIIILSIFVALIISNKAFAADLTTDLVSYWKLDESSGNASDSVGSNTLTNTSVTYGDAKINNGGVFNGSAKLELNDTDTLSFANKIVSFSFWFKANGLSNYNTFIYKGDPSNYEYQVLYDGTSDIIIFEFWDSTGNSIYKVSSNTGFDDNSWHHCLLYFNETYGKIYIDGSDETATSSGGGGTVTNGTGKFRLGGRDASIYLTGYLDEVGIWSRVLSETEITALYNAGSGLQYPFETSSTTPTSTIETISFQDYLEYLNSKQQIDLILWSVIIFILMGILIVNIFKTR